MKFSLILPVYHQADHVEKLVEQYKLVVKEYGHEVEIIFVVNGNDKKSESILRKIIKPPMKIEFLKEGGWGLAVVHGLKVAQGDYVVYTNSARTHMEDLLRIMRIAEAAKSYVIKASRITKDNWLRKLGSVIYNFEARLLFGVPVWDMNGTPKVIPKQYLKRLNITRIDDVVDAEVMVKCWRYHLPLIEVPVDVIDRMGGKSTTNIKSAINMYKGLWNLWLKG